MNEEAGFIAALLAEPDDRTALLVYADWLQERADPRAEYLHALLAKRPNQQRLKQLRDALDPAWVRLVTARSAHGVVRIREGSFAGSLAEVIDVRLNGASDISVVVRIAFCGRHTEFELPYSAVDHNPPPAA